MHCSHIWTEAEFSSHSGPEQPPQLMLTSRWLHRALHVPRRTLGFTPGLLCLTFSLPNLVYVSSDKHHKQDALIYHNEEKLVCQSITWAASCWLHPYGREKCQKKSRNLQHKYFWADGAEAHPAAHTPAGFKYMAKKSSKCTMKICFHTLWKCAFINSAVRD